MTKVLDRTCFNAGREQCKALEITHCSEQCPFYMKASDALKSRNTANRRLRSLPKKLQAYISNKYYGGTRPWQLVKIRTETKPSKV
ncbi:hypothetical protein FACS1894184_19730 [Clostridia bacterium]|nr:hypothetical protein FACS1894184_19730 [Clostridia bacterium]